MPQRPPVAEDSRGVHPTVSDPTHFSQLDQPVLTTGTGLELPRLGFGTYELTGSLCQEMVEAALDTGYRHIDTAQMYRNEDAVGAALAASGLTSSDVFITSKVSGRNHDPDHLQRSVDESLSKLGVDTIDLMLIGWPTEWERMGATLAALALVHADGLCRHIGVSNFTLEQLEESIDHAPLEALQVECHPYLAQAELRAWCRERDLAFVAYSPLAKGEVASDPTLQDVADDANAEPAQVALAWLLHQPGVAAIPRTSSHEHLRTNWEAQKVELDGNALATIDGLDRGERHVDPPDAPWR